MVVADDKRIVQCTLVGDKTTGKTSLARLCCKTFQRTEDSTVFDSYAATVSLKRNETRTVGIFDCSCQVS
jgi:GTPase SAR1 family protein